MPPVMGREERDEWVKRIERIKNPKRKKLLMKLGAEELESRHHLIMDERDKILQRIHFKECYIENGERVRRLILKEYGELAREYETYGRCNPNHKQWAFNKRQLKVIKEDPMTSEYYLNILKRARDDETGSFDRIKLALKYTKKEYSYSSEVLVSRALLFPIRKAINIDDNIRLSIKKSNELLHKKLKTHWEDTIDIFESFDYLNEPDCSDDKALTALEERESTVDDYFNEFTKKARATDLANLKKLYRTVNSLRHANQEELEDKTCAICLIEMVENKKFAKLPKCTACRRRFHKTCIGQWLKTHSNCVVCRHNLYSIMNINPDEYMEPYVVKPPEVEHWEAVYVGEEEPAVVEEEEEFEEYELPDDE